MLFDKLLRIYENYPAALEDHGVGEFCREAKLFQLDKTVKELTINFNIPELNSQFFLPFDVVAIEDKEGLVVLKHISGEGLGDQVFAFCALTDMSAVDDRLPMSGLALREMGFPDIKYSLMCGLIHAEGLDIVDFRNHFRRTTVIHLMGAYDSNCRELYDYEFTEAKGNLDEGLRFGAQLGSLPQTAIEEVIYFNDPEHFIMEVSNPKVKQPKPYSKTLPRTHQRPLYTLIRPKQAREKMGLSSNTGTGSAKHPHERRAHWRVLASDFYKNKKGQKVKIPASWIGPKQAQVGNKVYRILTDL